mmetsp:Transcript_985/g.1550  ORF Transcript_985/g.1550 Transcript_985/m.1550 type:complete len:160 (-) Transcript_985:207-686(-)
MVLSCTIAVLSTTGAPLIVLTEPPYPYLFLAAMLTMSCSLSCYIKKLAFNSVSARVPIDSVIFERWDEDVAKGSYLHEKDSVSYLLIQGRESSFREKTFAFFGARDGYALLQGSFLLGQSQHMEKTHRAQRLAPADTSHSILAKKYNLQSKISPRSLHK